MFNAILPAITVAIVGLQPVGVDETRSGIRAGIIETQADPGSAITQSDRRAAAQMRAKLPGVESRLSAGAMPTVRPTTSPE